MKAKVLKKFIDKHTGKVHNVGDTITISKERYAEILSVGKLVDVIVNDKEKTAKKGE